MKIGDEKILVTHCRFDRNDEWVEINKRFNISSEGAFDSENNQLYENVNIFGVDYICKDDFEKINKFCKEM